MISMMRCLVVHFRAHGNEEVRRVLGSGALLTPPPLNAPLLRKRLSQCHINQPWYSFNNRRSRIHRCESLYKCETCNYVTKNFSDMVRHRRSHLVGNTGVDISEVSETKPQQKVRRKPKKHICPICNKSFPWLCHLKEHMRTHAADKKYTCSECGYVAKDEADLVMHQRIHTFERQYRHLQSDFGATQAETLTKRMFPETEGQRRMETSDKEYAAKGNITIHLNCGPGTTNAANARQKIQTALLSQSTLETSNDTRSDITL